MNKKLNYLATHTKTALPTISVEELKTKYAQLFIAPENLQSERGLATGLSGLDRFLFWSGLPKGHLSLFHGASGQGATSLWSQTALRLTQQSKWVAWVNSSRLQLSPWHLQQQQADLSRLLVVSAPQTQKQMLWALQELISLSLFDLIGCDIGPHPVRDTQLLKLKKLARQYNTAVVLLSSHKFVHTSPFYSLILNFKHTQVVVERAQQRPTPRALSMASTLPLVNLGSTKDVTTESWLSTPIPALG